MYVYIPILVKHTYLKPTAVSIPLKCTQLDSSIKLKKQFIEIKCKQNSSIMSQGYKGIVLKYTVKSNLCVLKTLLIRVTLSPWFLGISLITLSSVSMVSLCRKT